MDDDDRDLLQGQPRFVGDIDHLRRFAALARTPFATDERGRALAEWRAFNTTWLTNEAVVEQLAKRPAKAAERPPAASVPPSKAGTRKAALRTVAVEKVAARKVAARKIAPWNRYRGKRGVDLRGVDFPGVILGTVDLGGARLEAADLGGAQFRGASFAGALLADANLSGALLLGADLRRADLSGARLAGADLTSSDLTGARLDRADLRGANLSHARLVEASIDNAQLDGCAVYGCSAWKVSGEPASSNDLVITPPGESPLLVDKLKLAQFMYLLLENAELRDVIDTLTSKTVLLLGRFSPERKPTLDLLRNALREEGYTSLMFDFDRPTTRSITEMVRLLAQMARYVIVDLTDPSSAPFEVGLLAGLGLRTTPVVPLVGGGQEPFGMLADLQAQGWMLPTVRYGDTSDLLSRLRTDVVAPAERSVDRLRQAGPATFG